jgi:hypothetical protein
MGIFWLRASLLAGCEKEYSRRRSERGPDRCKGLVLLCKTRVTHIFFVDGTMNAFGDVKGKN